MDKDRLNLLLNNTQELTADDFLLLKALRKEHPYMQGIYPLLAIGSKKYKASEYKSSLQTAAIYSLDRTHLKDILQSDGVQKKEENQIKPTIPDSQQKLTSPSNQDEHLTDGFFKELYDEMDKLKKSKEIYNSLLSKIETDSKEKKKSRVAASSKTVKAKAKSSPKKALAEKTKTKTTTKKKVTTAVKKPVAPKKEKVAKNKLNKASEIEHQSIIEEIKLKEIKAISDEHLMEQINMITSFIEKEPSINKKMLNHNVDAKRIIEDLSESSTHLAEDVISETLAKLMVKQGRKEKAIDIYKKLIWKFPQKKTYFADQIKKLKIEE